MSTRPNRGRHLRLVTSRQHETSTTCWGCSHARREPWEHHPTCPEWAKKEGCCSGT